MKRVWNALLAFLLISCLLCGHMAVMAERYDWQDDNVLQNWTPQSDAQAITATNILNPINPHASREARNLYAYLSSLSDTQTYLTGLFDADNSGNQYKQLVAETGYEPVVYSGRFKVDSSAPIWANGTTITNTTCDHTTVKETCASLKAHYEKGNILLVHADSVTTQLCIDILKKNKPEQYADGTNGIIELDSTNPDRDMQAYAVWMKFQQETIKALQALEDCGVKAYMWRPWIEFNYYEFCGVDREGYEAFTRVYQQTVQMLIDAELTGFLVCFSPGGYYDFIQRNPGNDYVDTYGTTLYLNINTIGNMAKDYYSSYEWYVRTGKPVGLTEWSCGGFDARGSSFDMASTLLNYYPRITWTNFWGGGTMAPLNMNGESAGNDDVMLYMSSPFALTLDEARDYRTGVIRAPGIAQLFDTADATGDYVGLEEKLYTAAELRELGITAKEIRALRLNTGYAITFYDGDNGMGEAYRYGFSQKNIPADTAAHFTSLEITRLSNVALEKSEIYASVNDGDAYKANDGMSARWSGNTYDEDNEAEPGTAWLRIDLETPYHVGRYVLRHAGAAGMMDMYNTVDFAIQYSLDGEHWVTIDQVKDNRLAEVDCYIEPVMAQHFRVLITKPNRSIYPADKGLVSISEFELYGVDAGGLASAEPEKPTTTTKKTTTTTKKVTTTTKKTTKKTTTTTALKLTTPKVTVSNATKGVKVSWGKVSKADKYYVYRKTGSGSWSKIKTTTSLSYTDEGAKAGKSYQYMVKAVKGSVTSGYKAVSITRLSVPKVTVSNASKGVKVSWGKVTGASKYYVYRKTGSGSWSKIKTTTSTSYTDTKASAGKSYQYMVKAVKGDYTSYYKAASIRRLKAPSSVKLAKATKGFKVSWSKVTGATKYEVYRKTGNGSYTKIATTTKTAYTDKTAKKGKYYTYRVRAVYSSYKSVFKTGSKTKR